MGKLTYGDPLPKSLGRCADLYHEVKELRLAMQKEVDAVKDRETEIYKHLVDNLSASDDTGAAGLKYRAQIKTDTVDTVDDWELVHDYVYENDRFDLLGKSLAKKAAKEMREAGVKIPGVKQMTVKKISVTKI